MAKELAPGGYHGQLVEPAISHSDRQSRVEVGILALPPNTSAAVL